VNECKPLVAGHRSLSGVAYFHVKYDDGDEVGGG
jgi:hypothetical protein